MNAHPQGEVPVRVATILNNFYIDRYPDDKHDKNQVRFTYDEGNNILWVQAPPNDMMEISKLIDRICQLLDVETAPRA